jgi:hypothetical protein
MSQLSLQSDGIQRLVVVPITFTIDIILVVAVSLLAGIEYNYFFLGTMPACS